MQRNEFTGAWHVTSSPPAPISPLFTQQSHPPATTVVLLNKHLYIITCLTAYLTSTDLSGLQPTCCAGPVRSTGHLQSAHPLVLVCMSAADSSILNPHVSVCLLSSVEEWAAESLPLASLPKRQNFRFSVCSHGPVPLFLLVICIPRARGHTRHAPLGNWAMPDVCRRRSLLHFLTSLRFTPHLRLCAQSTANLFWGRAGGAKKHHWHAPQSPQSTEYTKVGVSINGAQDRQSSWPNMLWPSNVSTSFGGWTAVVGRSSCRRQSSLPFSERPTCTRTVPKFRDCVLVRNACMRA